MAISVRPGAPAVFAEPRSLHVDVRLNVRAQPHRDSERIARVEPEAQLQAEALVSGERFLDQDLWFRLVGGDRFVWSGGVTVIDPAAISRGALPTNQLGDVERRADGTIKPLSVAQIEQVFGRLVVEERKDKPGFVRIERDWERRNITKLATPLLADLGFEYIRVHVKAAPHFAAVFEEIAQRQLQGVLLGCGGTFVPRHINRDPDRPLSSHSWGVAIDLNVEWNGYRRQPALAGLIGSVRELVPIFAAQGFAWGGHFSIPDGMHFELARQDA
jgi:hypothetical protein